MTQSSGHVFHPGHHALHGITVVVACRNAVRYVGRFDREDEEFAYLKDVGVFDGSGSWDDFLDRTKRFGIKVEHRQLRVARSDISEVRPLGQA